MAPNSSNRSLSPVPGGLRRGSAAGDIGFDGLDEDGPPAGIPSTRVRADSGAQARSEHSDVSDVENDAAEEAQTIYERGYGPWRYELPDEYRETTPPSRAQDDSKTVRNMALSWEEYDKFPKIVDVSQDNVASRPGTEKEVTWLHVQEQSLDLKAVENCLSQRDLTLRKRELYLSQHLLKRVEDEAQRPYPSGLSCKPIALTYHSKDPTKRTPDGTASFLCFPYFLLADQEAAKTGSVNKKVHPTRTLLQYQFPLETSKVRDRDCQCVRSLNVATLKGHVTAYTPRQGETDETRVSQIFHVPQLWCLTIGSGKLLTYGSIAGSDISALSVEIEQKPPCTNPVYRPAVRFNFRHKEMPQELTFAIEECHSAYGLRNKKNQILHCQNIKKDDRQSYRLHLGEKGGHLIDEKTWPIILRTEEEGKKASVLDLWMDHQPGIPRDAPSTPRALSPMDHNIPQDGQASAGAQDSDAVNHDVANTSQDGQPQAIQDKNIPDIRLSEPDKEIMNNESERDAHFPNGIAESSVPSNSTDHSQIPSISESRGRLSPSARPKQIEDSNITKGSADRKGNQATQNSELVALGNSKWADYAKKVPPLLYWPIANEDGVAETYINEERASKILEVIYRRIDKADPRSIMNTNAQGPLTPGDKKEQPDRSPSGVLLKTKKDLTQKFGKEHRGYKLFQSLCRLWDSFVPDTHQPDSTSVKYFWGLVSQLLEPEDSQKAPPTVNELYVMREHVKKIDGLAKGYLLGVYCHDLANTVEHPSDQEKTLGFSRHLARGAFLLEATVEAFAAIHSMVSAGWLETNDRTITGVPHKGSGFAKRAEEAQGHLRIAMARTRADLNRTTHDRLVGPIMTPETVLIKVLNALTKGVFGKGNVNIIDIYDGRLQELVKETRDRRPTRHLLAEISDYQEQLASILNVLEQQHRVLQQLRTNLNPARYSSSSVSRRIQFEYEARALDEIQKLVKSQRADCAAFQERTKELALQLLQKVEAFQDDNNKAILVFTLFTVFFLPLSFVTGFYGMNLTAFPPEDEYIGQFWLVAVPITGLITFIALVVLFKDSLKRRWQKTFSAID